MKKPILVKLRLYAHLPLALVIIVLIMHIWSLMRYPAPFVDEAWFGSRSWGFLHTGKSFGPLDAGVFDRLEGYWTFLPWLPSFFQSIALRLAGAPSLFALRLVSLISGLLLLLAVYAIGVQIRGRSLGLLGVAVTAFSWPFIYSAHLARPDIMAAALGFIAISLSLSKKLAYGGRTGSSKLSIFLPTLISGLLVGLAFEIHPHSAIYAPAILTLFIVDGGWRIYRSPRFWGFVAGLALGLAFYVAMHILPYPQSFVVFNRLAFTATHTPPLLTLSPTIIFDGFIDLGKLLIVVYQPLLILIVWGAILLSRHRFPGDRTLLALGIALITTFLLLARNKFFMYVILFTPVLDLWIATVLFDVIHQPWHAGLSRIFRNVLVLGICLGMLVSNLTQLKTNTYHAYQEIQKRINLEVQPGDSLIAPQIYWLGLSDHTFYSWEELVYFRRYFPGSNTADAFMEFRPDIFILDGHMAQYVRDLPGDTLYYEHLILPKQELENFLAQNAQLVDAFPSSLYGQIRIYRLTW